MQVAQVILHQETHPVYHFVAERRIAILQTTQVLKPLVQDKRVQNGR